MAQIDIGKLTFNHLGDYASGTAYVKNDVVYYNGSAYIAKQSISLKSPTKQLANINHALIPLIYGMVMGGILSKKRDEWWWQLY